MDVFNLPQSTKFGKVVPKNSFDEYMNTKQKKEMTDLIARIVWANKLSKTTVNLETGGIDEIQVFTVELKVKSEIKTTLDLMDKASPYYIIFVIIYNEAYYLSTSTKHPHPNNPDDSVIDWNFKSEWIDGGECPYKINLGRSLEAAYLDFCKQLSGESSSKTDISGLVKKRQEIAQLEKEIVRLETQIKNCKQFKKKVELNIKVKRKKEELHFILDSN